MKMLSAYGCKGRAGVRHPTPGSSLKHQKVSHERLVLDLQEKVGTIQETIKQRTDRLSVLGEEYEKLQRQYRQAISMGNLLLASTVVRELTDLVKRRLWFLKQEEFGQLQQLRQQARRLDQPIIAKTIVSLIRLGQTQAGWLEEEASQLGYRLDAEERRNQAVC